MLARVTRKDLINERSLVYFDCQEKAKLKIDDLNANSSTSFIDAFAPKRISGIH